MKYKPKYNRDKSKSPPKERLPSLSWLRDELDRVYSLWIRQKDAKDRKAVCVTCGKEDDWRYLQCGHYWSRKEMSLRFEPKNTHVQCFPCNYHKKGNIAEYTIFLIKKYGAEIIDWLHKEKNKTVKFSRADYMSMIEEYKSYIEKIGGELK